MATLLAALVFTATEPAAPAFSGDGSAPDSDVVTPAARVETVPVPLGSDAAECG